MHCTVASMSVIVRIGMFVRIGNIDSSVRLEVGEFTLG
jgi:hypothetical protein